MPRGNREGRVHPQALKAVYPEGVAMSPEVCSEKNYVISQVFLIDMTFRLHLGLGLLSMLLAQVVKCESISLIIPVIVRTRFGVSQLFAQTLNILLYRVYRDPLRIAGWTEALLINAVVWESLYTSPLVIH